MNTKVNVGEHVYNLTLNQLGTILYHIANATDVSLDYTDRFKREVMTRVSGLLCNAIGFEGSLKSINDLIDETWSDFIATLEEPAEEDQPVSLNELLEDSTLTQEEMEAVYDRYVQQCVSHPDISCHCTPSERLKCEWANDPWEADRSLYEEYSQQT